MVDSILEVKGICMEFPGVKALDDVSFDLRAGEVHILVGENGAGKSTLAKVILGAYQPDAGEIILHGETVKHNSARDALKAGIAAVYQEFTLVPYLNVAQNIFLNREYIQPLTGLVDHARMHREAKDLLKMLNVDYIDTKTIIKKLGVAAQQMVEIAKALSIKPKIIIFDEPTATLSEREVESLFKQIHKLKESGIGVIYVSHRMQEFPLIGDRITVLRDGKKIGTVNIGDVTNDELVKMMVGRDISQVYVHTPHTFGDEVLRTENLSDRYGKVNDVNIVLHKGEIVGLAGLVGSGRTEVARLIFGVDKIKSGKVYIYGKPVVPTSPAQIVKLGVGLLPEDRKRQGLALKMSVSWNILTVSLRKYFPNLFVQQKKVDEIARKSVKELRVATPTIDRLVRFLSGGNQQKVVVAKWLTTESRIIIFDEPTRGIDVGAKMEIFALMDKLATEGLGILMISSEMPEVIGMSDRIYIMREGHVVGECDRGGLCPEDIGSLMLGISKEATNAL